MNDLVNCQNSNEFFENVARIIEQARRFVGRTADLTMCVTYFEVGRMIVEEEQGGKARAEYGRRLLTELSAFLNGRVKKGFSETNLKNARKFYQVYAGSIRQTLSAELAANDNAQNQQKPSAEFENFNLHEISQAMLGQSYPFSLGWSHYQVLIPSGLVPRPSGAR
jgi:hypothetical protein